ncbi:hypothetical protein ANTQUA_LOCUS7565 [Anthophora quadrimaculata]
MSFVKFFFITCLLGIYLEEIQGHGMMLDPVSRSSAWRKGFPVEPNYNDNEVYCGGFYKQYMQNGGKCGECGDDYALPRPRPNDNGGIYGLGLNVRNYTLGQIVNVKVKLTANHLGTFRFHLCQLHNIHHVETEECFDEYPLQLADGGYEMNVPSTKMDFEIAVRLPNDLVCEHCVLRWTYRCGNNWGQCDNGMSGLGCGPQETFRNCADVSIGI